ncbi:MAG: DUF456 domain-containing protein [Actinomycetales bacterium]
MAAELLWTVLCGLAILVGAAGTIIPVLPGSALIAVALLVWAIVVGGPLAWVVFAAALVFVLAGAVSSTVLTGRALRKRRIPGWSILVGVAGAAAGFFLIPVVGLLVGFAAGLFLSELGRQRHFAPALRSSAAALKATGLGILVEFGCAAVAGGIWTAGALVHFATA